LGVLHKTAKTLMQVSNMTMAIHCKRYLDLITEYFKYAKDKELAKTKIEPLGVDLNFS
jgi:hypothetical protein